MSGHEFFFGYWWIFPLVMIVFCILFARRGCGESLCGFGAHKRDTVHGGGRESSLEILDRRFTQGEINQHEYEQKKKVLTRS